MLLIVDDIQMGCGRTGAFFSFEEAGIVPDIVTVSKSISGYGMPMALCLFKPELDVWEPGEHNGTFRGNNPAFVTAAATLETYWTDGSAMEKQTRARAASRSSRRSPPSSRRTPATIKEYRGRGLVWGMEFLDKDRAGAVAKRAFELGLLIETSGPRGRGRQAPSGADDHRPTSWTRAFARWPARSARPPERAPGRIADPAARVCTP